MASKVIKAVPSSVATRRVVYRGQGDEEMFFELVIEAADTHQPAGKRIATMEYTLNVEQVTDVCASLQRLLHSEGLPIPTPPAGDPQKH